MPLIVLGQFALIIDWWLGNWWLGVWVPVRFKPGIGDNTTARLAPGKSLVLEQSLLIQPNTVL